LVQRCGWNIEEHPWQGWSQLFSYEGFCKTLPACDVALGLMYRNQTQMLSATHRPQALVAMDNIFGLLPFFDPLFFVFLFFAFPTSNCKATQVALFLLADFPHEYQQASLFWSVTLAEPDVAPDAAAPDVAPYVAAPEPIQDLVEGDGGAEDAAADATGGDGFVYK